MIIGTAWKGDFVMSFLQEVFNFTSLILEPVEYVNDLKNDVQEIICDYPKEYMRGNTDYKTSSDMRDEADKIISDVKSKYHREYKKLCEKVKYINNKLADLDSKKKQLILQNNQESIKSIRYRQNANYDNLESPRYVPVVPLTSPFSENYCDLIEIEKRRDCARDYLESAKDFSTEVKVKIFQMENTKIKLEAIDEVLSDEDRLLNSLMHSLSVNRSKVDQRVFEILVQLVCSSAFDKNLDINDEYVSAINMIDQYSCL